MKLWIGAELDADVADSFREARKHVEAVVNRVIMPKSYDLPLHAWDCIAIVRADEDFSERVDYSTKRQEMDFRLRIDHAAFKSGTQQQRVRLVFAMLRRSLELLASKLSSPPSLEDLQTDLQAAEAIV